MCKYKHCACKFQYMDTMTCFKNVIIWSIFHGIEYTFTRTAESRSDVNISIPLLSHRINHAWEMFLCFKSWTILTLLMQTVYTILSLYRKAAFFWSIIHSIAFECIFSALPNLNSLPTCLKRENKIYLLFDMFIDL